MANLTVNSNTYAYPDPGSEQGWGEDATGWADDVTTVLDSLAGAGTINETQALIDLTATNKEVVGLLFNTSIVQSAEVFYRIYRTSSLETLSESGTLELVYDPATSQWAMTREFTSNGNTKVSLNVTGNTTGQVVYTSTALTGTGYSGYIKFKTITILQTT